MGKKYFIVFIGYVLTSSILSAQSTNLDSLEKELNHGIQDSAWAEKAIHYTRELHRQNGHSQKKENDIAQKAVVVALTLKDTLLYAKALDNRGLLYRFHEWYEQALPLHIKAYNLVKDKPVDPLNKMIFANNAGLAARYNQQYDLSVFYYLKALKLAQKYDQSRNIAISSNGLGNAIAHIRGKDKQAFAYFKNALKVEEQRGDSLGMAMNLLSISEYYVKEENYPEALKNLHRLKTINENRKDTFGLALTDESYGHAYMSEGKTAKAEQFYNRALQLYNRTHKPTNSAQVLHKLGDIQSQLGHYSLALDFYDRSLNLADSLKNGELLMKNAYSISELEEKQGNYLSGLQWYKKGKVYEDSIAIKQQKVEITALERQYNLDKKETEIDLLQKEQALSLEKMQARNERLGTRRNYIAIVLIGSILVIVFLLVQHQNLKAKRLAELKLRIREKSLLEAEYEKNMAQAEMLISRLQINPHFIFNCLNAVNLFIQKGENHRAKKYVIALSRFIRMVLELPKNETVSLAEELELIRNYIELERKRFDHNFCFAINTDIRINLTEVNIPPLLLQPFVENALLHGLIPSNKKEKKLAIDIKPEEGAVKILIDDNGVGRKGEPTYQKKKVERRKSLGMRITKERIRQFNKGLDYHIDLSIIDKSEKSGTRVVLILNGAYKMSPNIF